MQIEYKEHQDLIKNIAKKNGIDDYDLKIEPGSEDGDGYVSHMVKVIITSKIKNLNFLLKLAPVEEKYKKLVKEIFSIESWMYEKILPAFDEFQKNHGLLNGFSGYAKCFGACAVEKREAIAMENLTVSGYQLWDRTIPMNHDHIALVLKEYGKFHAVSLGIRHKNPDLFEEMKHFLRKYLTEEYKQKMKSFVDTVVSSIHKSVQGYRKLENVLKTLIEKSEQFWLHELLTEENQLVLVHGDCWCNNMLFKYEDSAIKVPSKVCLIDWQVVRIGNPVTDIACFFTTSSSKETLYNYQTYLKIYHDSLSNSLRSMSLDPEDIYPFSLLEEHWAKYARIAVYLAPTVIPFLVVQKDEINALSDFANVGDFVEKMSGSKAGEESDKRIRDLMEFMAEHNFI